MTKTKEQTVRVRVNPASRNGTDRDEVSIQSAKWEPPKDESGVAEPYINRMVYAKPGIFKDGELSETEADKLEEKSNKVLAEERERQEKEAQERIAAEAKSAEAKKDQRKSEG